MVVRAFHTGEFVILMDAVLRANNYCAHHQLAQRLGLQPKELRQMLNRMVQARLMRSDKRTQKKINIHDDRRPVRTVTTEFWYVPLGTVVDTFLYRVHKITKGIEERRKNEIQRQKHECTSCNTVYDLLDILHFQSTKAGLFICEKMGVRVDRRPFPCGGVIKEQDNSAKVKELERTKQMVIVELRELRERAAVLARMDIPNHPLANVDDKDIVPEMVDKDGEKVDEDGVKIADKEAAKKAAAAEVAAEKGAAHIDDNFIPEKPSWFKESTIEEGDDEWDFEQDNFVSTKKGTAASFNEEEEKSYFERYLQEIGGTAEPTTAPASTAPAVTVPAATATAAPAPAATLAGNVATDSKPPASSKIAKVNTVDERVDYGTNDALVSVAGKQIKWSEVTEEMQESMTPEEYKAYFALAQPGGDDDDDDEFE